MFPTPSLRCGTSESTERMAVLFDSNFLLLLLQPGVPAPLDPVTGKPLTYCEERVNYLVAQLSKARTAVLIPTPVLTEVLCNAGGAGSAFVQQLQTAPFQLAPFDVRAAIDCADLLAFHLAKRGNGKGKAAGPGKPGSRDKVKFDRQIVAIAKSRKVDAIYSDDEDVAKEAGRVGLRVIRTFELERDPSTSQAKLDLKHPDSPEAGSW